MSNNKPAYDPLNYETWPDEQRMFAARVWEGLHDGDLKPLAEYLRAGHYIDPPLATEIAEAIDGGEFGFFNIVAKGKSRGQRGLTAFSEAADRKLTIGVYMEERVRRYGKGGYDAALRETCDKFGIKSSATVAKARKFLLDHMASAEVAPGWDHWENLKRVYFTP